VGATQDLAELDIDLAVITQAGGWKSSWTHNPKCGKVLPTALSNTSMATNLTSKGQVTVPKKVRDYLGLKPGKPVAFERLPTGEIALKAAKANAKPRMSKFAKLRGRATVRMSTEEILALTRG
jgi:antitoxin PrlF